MLDGAHNTTWATFGQAPLAAEARTEELVRVRASHLGAAVVVTAHGEIDISTVRAWEQRLDQACSEIDAPGAVVVELDGLSFIGACGLRTLESAWQRCWGRGVVLRVVTSTPLYQAMLSSVGVLDVLESYPTVAAALAARTD